MYLLPTLLQITVGRCIGWNTEIKRLKLGTPLLEYFYFFYGCIIGTFGESFIKLNVIQKTLRNFKDFFNIKQLQSYISSDFWYWFSVILKDWKIESLLLPPFSLKRLHLVASKD